MSQSQYDLLAELSEQTANSPLRKFYEEHTMFEVLGDVTGLTVLDLACGTGLYTRRFKERGATRALGVDNAEGMIAYARHLEKKEPLGVEYLVKDASDLGEIGTFDCVVGTYLLHYAPSREALRSICTNIRKALKPDGRFVTICVNPAINLTDPSYYLNYGFKVSGGESDGAPLSLEIVVPGLETTLSAFRWSRETYEAALKHAGFCDLVWHSPQLDPLGIEIFGEAYWTAYLATPHAVVLTARPG